MILVVLAMPRVVYVMANAIPVSPKAVRPTAIFAMMTSVQAVVITQMEAVM